MDNFLIVLRFCQIVSCLYIFFNLTNNCIGNLSIEAHKPLKFESFNETSIQIAGLNGTIYKETFQQLTNIKELRICKSSIIAIEPGSLCTNPKLTSLELDFFENVLQLTKETFKGCEHLEELLIKYDFKLKQIPVDYGTLEGLTNLKRLSLKGFKFENLTKNFLKLPHNKLQELHFYVCSIQELDENTFEDLKDLQVLTMNNNEIKKIPVNLFKNNDKLKTLGLRSNNVENLSWDEFKWLSNLENLWLAENSITSFNAEKVAKYLPKLQFLSLELNPAECKTREAFVLELKKIFPNVDVTYKFDSRFYDSCEEE